MKVSRKNISTETPWESIFGYSRAVRIGPYVYISGTTATDKSGNVVGIGDPYTQSIQIMKNIQAALQKGRLSGLFINKKIEFERTENKLAFTNY